MKQKNRKTKVSGKPHVKSLMCHLKKILLETWNSVRDHALKLKEECRSMHILNASQTKRGLKDHHISHASSLAQGKQKATVFTSKNNTLPLISTVGCLQHSLAVTKTDLHMNEVLHLYE